MDVGPPENGRAFLRMPFSGCLKANSFWGATYFDTQTLGERVVVSVSASGNEISSYRDAKRENTLPNGWCT